MARINNEEWLHEAKRMAIGQQSRVRHGHEPDAAMVVGNTQDRWWCYCQRCKAGAVEMKSHVLLTQVEPPQSRSLVFPQDAKPINELPKYQQEFIAGFLASKNMDFTYLPPLHWSESRHRLMVPTDIQWFGEHPKRLWMGRDTSGRSAQKWLTFNGQHMLSVVGNDTQDLAVIVEDAFSMYKVAWAAAHAGIEVAVYCSLGTTMHDSLFIRCLRSHARVASFYDGDLAGHKGALDNSTRLRAAGIGIRLTSEQQCATEGLDPKDMQIEYIVQHLHKLKEAK